MTLGFLPTCQGLHRALLALRNVLCDESKPVFLAFQATPSTRSVLARVAKEGSPLHVNRTGLCDARRAAIRGQCGQSIGHTKRVHFGRDACA